MASTAHNTRRLVTLAIFTALIVVLQLVANVAKIGPFSITLSLVPIVIGAGLYGVGAGAYLGGVFGLVVLICCITGMDMGGAILWNANPFTTAFVCLLKGVAAGAVAGLIFRLVTKGSLKGKRGILAAILAGLAAPITNTGLFVLGMVLFFHDTLVSWAGGTDLVYYVIFGLTGLNFLLEVIVNMVLAPIIPVIITARKK